MLVLPKNAITRTGKKFSTKRSLTIKRITFSISSYILNKQPVGSNHAYAESFGTLKFEAHFAS
jgi:hypothetical protein